VDIANAVGLPEARLPLADAVVLVATAPKSNSAYDGINAAIADIQAGRTGPIPRQLQNKHYDGADAKIKGQHYLYPHDYPNHWVAQQYLPDAVVDFVGTGVVQVFTLEVNPATVLLGQAVCQVEWGRASHVVAQQLVVFTLEVLTLQHLEVSILQLFYTFVEDFGNVCPAELSVITFFVN